MEYGLPNVLRFYDAVEKQNREFGYVNGNLRTFKNITSTSRFGSFQIEVDSAVTASTDVVVWLVDLSDTSETNITSDFTWDTDLYVEVFTSNNYLIYNGASSMSIAQGKYYLKVVAASTYYSEVFCVTDTTGKMIIDYWGDRDIASIDYSNGAKAQFKNRLILTTAPTRPQYLYDEDGTEDGNATFLPTFQKRTKRYQFTFYAPEYIIDAVTLIPLHDNITVYTYNGKSNGETITVEEFDVTSIEWNDLKGFAKVVCEFRGDPIVKTLNDSNIT